jgi:ribosome-associated protein
LQPYGVEFAQALPVGPAETDDHLLFHTPILYGISKQSVVTEPPGRPPAGADSRRVGRERLWRADRAAGPGPDGMILITPELAIPEEEISFTVSRSRGPGGQHVNKTSTRVTLLFDLDGSPTLTPEQVTRLRARLGARVSREGILRVTAQRHRSQLANKQAAVERFAQLLRESLTTDRPRVPSRPSRQQRERRLAAKRMRARRKAERAGGRRLLEEADD